MSEDKGLIVRSKKVQTYVERAYCNSDKCSPELVEMEKEPTVLMSMPPQYQYKCPKCGYTSTSHNSYPQTVIKEEF